jgi:hypothetical protein
MTIPVHADRNQWGDDRTHRVCGGQFPPWSDGPFCVNQVRRRTASAERPLTNEEIQQEAQRLLSALQAPRNPTVPTAHTSWRRSRRTFWRGLPPRIRTGSWQRCRVHSTTFSGLNDRKGHFVLITKTRTGTSRSESPVVLCGRSFRKCRMAQRSLLSNGVNRSDKPMAAKRNRDVQLNFRVSPHELN